MKNHSRDVPANFYDLDYFKVMLKTLLDKDGKINKHLDERLQEILKFVQPRQDDIVLDIGCGTGHLLLHIVDRVKKVIGVDYSETAIKIARYLFKDIDKEKYELFCADLLELDYDFSPSLVLMIDIIEHIRRDRFAHLLKKVRNKISPGSRIIVETPLAPEDTFLDPDFSGGPEETRKRYQHDQLLKDYEYLHISRYSFDALVSMFRPLRLNRTLHPDRNLFEFVKEK